VKFQRSLLPTEPQHLALSIVCPELMWAGGGRDFCPGSFGFPPFCNWFLRAEVLTHRYFQSEKTIICILSS
jgi:hypothetical protein